jgi:hypothetical protein
VPNEVSKPAKEPAHQIDIRKESGYLHVILRGRRTPETIKAMAEAIYAACTEHECFKVLADTRELIGRLSVVDQYYIPSQIPNDPAARRIRLAAIDLEKDRKIWTFFETVFRNAGYKVKIFTDPDEAINWLTK